MKHLLSAKIKLTSFGTPLFTLAVDHFVIRLTIIIHWTYQDRFMKCCMYKFLCYQSICNLLERRTEVDIK